MPKFLNACVWKPTSGGTGTWTVDAAVAPYNTPADCVGPAVEDGGTYNYHAKLGSDYERGTGVYTASGTTFTRNVIESTNGDAAVNFSAAPDVQMGNAAAADIATDGLLYKADWQSVAFTKTGAFAASIKAGTKVGVAGTVVTFASATAITMPSPTTGTDYAIWVKDDATIQASTSFSSAPGAGNWRKIGGFHYAPGGNATGTSGGDSTPAINAYSIWDIKFRPAASDPRGMALIAGRFWCDIYLLGVNHHTDGTSKYGATIADGSSPPKIPTAFGGNGSTAYGSLTWWEAAEVMAAYGKDLLAYDEFAAAAYGVTEGASVGADPGTTGLDAPRTSKWGIMRATGNMWVWGRNLGGTYNTTAAWQANTGSRGQTYSLASAVILGGSWDYGALVGSRASAWNNAPSASGSAIGARGRCDHVMHL